MKTTFHNLTITSVFKGGKVWPQMPKNKNNHVITIVNNDTKTRVSFDFWGSVSDPVIDTEQKLLNAFYCFVSEAEMGSQSYEDACANLGEIEFSTYRALEKMHEKFEKVCDEDIYDLLNELQELDAA